jgi:glutathione S-transferase
MLTFNTGANPFGHLPSLHIDGKSLFESAAIARYLDDHHSNNDHPLRPQTQALLTDTLASVASDYVFKTVEFTYVKPRMARESEGIEESIIQKELATGSSQVEKVLEEVERLADTQGPFLTGKEITWADLFMYPPLADLKSIPVSNADCVILIYITFVATTCGQCISYYSIDMYFRKVGPYVEVFHVSHSG